MRKAIITILIACLFLLATASAAMAVTVQPVDGARYKLVTLAKAKPGLDPSYLASYGTWYGRLIYPVELGELHFRDANAGGINTATLEVAKVEYVYKAKMSKQAAYVQFWVDPADGTITRCVITAGTKTHFFAPEPWF